MLNHRYIEIEKQNNIMNAQPREMVLLKGRPCQYGVCAFCDYPLDNHGYQEEEAVEFNHQLLMQVSGKYGVLEVINSGSIFEIPEKSLQEIERVAINRGIKIIYFEALLTYHAHLEALKKRFLHSGITVYFRLGVESFDENFRMEYLNKKITQESIIRFAPMYESACLLVGVKNQTREMIRQDIELGLTYFNRLTLNVFVNNSREIKADEALIQWFLEFCQQLKGENRIEIFLNNYIFE